MPKSTASSTASGVAAAAGASSVFTSAKRAPGTPVKFEDLLAKLAAKDRTNLERHLAAADAEGDGAHAKLFRHVTRVLATFAPHALTTVGQQALQFFIADGGKYKKQVFAMEDQRDGKLLVYLPDVLAAGIKAGIITAPKASADPTLYPIKAAPGHTLKIEPLDNTNTPNPHAFYKHMLGWNRKALRVSLPVGAPAAETTAFEALVAVAAKEWTAA